MDTHNTPAQFAEDSFIPAPALNAYRILVINSKDGAGKTTVSTNLAAWLAYRDETTVLFDADPNASSSLWVQQRSTNLPRIYGCTADNHTVSNLPTSAQWLITDAPAGISGEALNDAVMNHDLIIIPVTPSDADIQTTARFIGELLLTHNMRHHRRPIAVIANRTKQQTNDAWERLQKFLNSLKIPYPTTLRDNSNYVRAYREGQGVVDYQQQGYLRDRADWEMLTQWIDAQYAEHQQRGAETAEVMLKEKCEA